MALIPPKLKRLDCYPNSSFAMGNWGGGTFSWPIPCVCGFFQECELPPRNRMGKRCSACFPVNRLHKRFFPQQQPTVLLRLLETWLDPKILGTSKGPTVWLASKMVDVGVVYLKGTGLSSGQRQTPHFRGMCSCVRLDDEHHDHQHHHHHNHHHHLHHHRDGAWLGDRQSGDSTTGLNRFEPRRGLFLFGRVSRCEVGKGHQQEPPFFFGGGALLPRIHIV